MDGSQNAPPMALLHTATLNNISCSTKKISRLYRFVSVRDRVIYIQTAVSLFVTSVRDLKANTPSTDDSNIVACSIKCIHVAQKAHSCFLKDGNWFPSEMCYGHVFLGSMFDHLCRPIVGKMGTYIYLGFMGNRKIMKPKHF